MKLKEIISFCNDLCVLGINRTCFSSDIPPDDGAVRLLTQSCNQVLLQLRTEFFPIRRQATVTAVQRFLPFDSLPVAKVFFVTDKLGNKVTYRHGAGGLYVNADGDHTLTYALAPSQVEWKDEVDLPRLVSRDLFAYGVLADFFTHRGQLNQAHIYTDKYLLGIEQTTRRLSDRHIRRPKWL